MYDANDAIKIAECRIRLWLVDGEEARASHNHDRAHAEEGTDVARDDQDHPHERCRGGEAPQVVQGA